MHKLFRAGSFLVCRNLRSVINSTNSDQRLLSGNSSKNFHLFPINTCKKMSNNTGTSSSASASGSSASSLSIPRELPKFTNRLIQEKSPYLLQHAHNPVDWYPWCDEAIKKAKNENKLIFLSVGYSTCHWCHVMEHESFENEDIAKIMNENFVNIKVDREERPDIDKIYMNFLLMINGSGGWPMSVWLTPDLTPITAGSYFPPTDRWGMPGFKTVLTKIIDEWNKNQSELRKTGNYIIQAISKSISEKSLQDSNNDTRDKKTPEAQLNLAIKIYKRNFDEIYGGFGSHPKFPEIPKINFLFHAYTITKDKDIIKIVLKTLNKIGSGGIHDHIFGGFSRYSVDRKWHVPHFEKMLYDQGQLLSAYANAYKITNDQYYLDIADGIFSYLIKDLRHPLGGYYSGEDADSLPTINDKNKIEGAFYAWTYSEIKNIFENNTEKFDNLLKTLNIDIKKLFEIYCYHYDIKNMGNVEPSSDPHGHLNGKNILIVRKNLNSTSKKFKIELNKLKELLKISNNLLHEIRDKRPRPHLDTKIITAWNGLVLSGLSKISMSCTERRDEYLKAAKELIAFLKKYSFDKEKNILLRACYGKGIDDELTEILSEPIGGFLDDYAFLIKGLLDYYKATLDLDALEWAKELQDIQDSLFWDDKNGGYFYSQENSPNVIVRLKEDHDGAEPCGNSVAARNLILISAYFEEPEYKAKSKKLLDFFDNSTQPMGYVLPEMMSALLLLDRGLEMTAVIGTDCDRTKEFLNICRRYYIPGMIVVHFNINNPSVVKRKTAEKFKMINNQPTVYICHNKACQLPITDPLKLEEIFKSKYILLKTQNDSESDDD